MPTITGASLQMANSGTILLVDDSADDVLLIREAFKRAGNSNPIISLTDGEAALAYLKGESKYANRTDFPIPILMLLDLKMPKVNGFEVLHWIRKRPEWSCLPVIVLTTSFYGPDIERAYDLGANSFLTKPGDLPGFIREVKQVSEFWLRASILPGVGPFVPPPSQMEAETSKPPKAIQPPSAPRRKAAFKIRSSLAKKKSGGSAFRPGT